MVILDIEHCPIPSVTTQTLGRDDFVGGAASAVVTGFLWRTWSPSGSHTAGQNDDAAAAV